MPFPTLESMEEIARGNAPPDRSRGGGGEVGRNMAVYSPLGPALRGLGKTVGDSPPFSPHSWVPEETHEWVTEVTHEWVALTTYVWVVRAPHGRAHHAPRDWCGSLSMQIPHHDPKVVVGYLKCRALR